MVSVTGYSKLQSGNNLQKICLLVCLLVVVLLTGALLAGCAGKKNSSMTCQQYSGESYSDQTDTVIKMIQEHNLDPSSSVWGSAKIAVDVNNYCGMDLGKATKNLDSPIENAVDWDSVSK